MTDQFEEQAQCGQSAERRKVDTRDELVARIAKEFREMAGLSLTERQACRLFGLDVDQCARMMRHLHERGIATVTADGLLRRPEQLHPGENTP